MNAPTLAVLIVEHGPRCPGATRNGRGCNCKPITRLVPAAEFERTLSKGKPQAKGGKA